MDEEHPPKVRMALRVGVTGHRLDSLRDAGFDEALLRSTIRGVLERIRDTVTEILRENKKVYAPDPPALRIISPLAEGADRFVAEEALGLNDSLGVRYEIQAPLPFSQADYEEDFTEKSSKLRFQELLEKSTSTLILDGSRRDEKSEVRAYESVGRIVIRQSDLLIAIWNGQEAKGKGGTGQIVKEALDRKLPIIWINPHSISMIESISEDGAAASWKNLNELVPLRKLPEEEPDFFLGLRQIFTPKEEEKRPPAIPYLDAKLREILELKDPRQIKALHHFLGEAQPQFRAAVFYRAFCKIFVPAWKIPPLEVKDFRIDREEEWFQAWHSLSDSNRSVGKQIEQWYRKLFVWADVMADICADRYRSSFVGTYLLGAFAVLAAFLGADPKGLPTLISGVIESSHSWFWVELIFISSILLLVLVFNKRGRWHERWIDYRLLAEGLRQMRALAPFARVTPAFEVPAHLSEDVSSATWFNWYFRAITRNAGLVSAKIDESYLKICRSVLVTEILSQTRYHKKTERQYEELHTVLHWLSITLFICTFIACVAHLYIGDKREESLIDGLLTLCAIVLPAFGAAIQGILHQGEFGRIARRSRAIRKRLRELLRELRAGRRDLSFRNLGQTTESFSKIQILEQADWRSVFIIKEVSLP